MARITKPLNNTEIKQAKAKDKEYSLADGQGLMLRIKPNGSKLWLFNYYRPFSKKRANLSFGKYPDVSLAEARDKRAEARSLIAKEIDPKTHKEELNHQQKEALENTFGVLAEKWLELKKQQVKPETAEKAYQSLTKHILPSLQKVPVQSIKPKLIIDILQPVANKGSLETVKCLCRIINEVMRLAIASGQLEINYLADITKLFPAPKKTNMATIEPKRLPELMSALSIANITRTTRCLVEWQLHTMTRPIETATARWEDIDLENKVWVIPAERMKMKKAHTIPLTPQTLALVEVLHSMRGQSEYLFQSHISPKKHANSQTANMALKRMGFAGELVSHGLRALASTTLNEQGFDPDVIESALAHIDKNEVRRAYNRAEYLERRRKLMCWWSNHIEQSAIGKMDMSNCIRSLKVVNL
ncbi:integrase domain-containing protein [Psychromonas hadalis]|uniref:integrase domain-containing protein n=1 Tax=Psychromonas hadalis TaxID=211669 RepID=UPI0003B38A07|nr:integrase domain-containing protein [Psychromonas hadalis]